MIGRWPEDSLLIVIHSMTRSFERKSQTREVEGAGVSLVGSLANVVILNSANSAGCTGNVWVP